MRGWWWGGDGAAAAVAAAAAAAAAGDVCENKLRQAFIAKAPSW